MYIIPSNQEERDWRSTHNLLRRKTKDLQRRVFLPDLTEKNYQVQRNSLLKKWCTIVVTKVLCSPSDLVKNVRRNPQKEHPSKWYVQKRRTRNWIVESDGQTTAPQNPHETVTVRVKRRDRHGQYSNREPTVSSLFTIRTDRNTQTTPYCAMACAYHVWTLLVELFLVNTDSQWFISFEKARERCLPCQGCVLYFCAIFY